MNKYIIIILSLILVIGYSCTESSYEELQRPGTNSIYATFEDGTGFFNPETASPYEDVINFVFSTHFPVESDNVIDISRMKLRAYDPVSVILPDGSDVVDLTKETKIIIVQIDGTQKECNVKGEIRKSSEAQIKEFSLPVSNLPGIINEQRKIIGLVPGGINLISQKPKLTLSPHSTISPDTANVQDFSKPVVYEVTAEDGTKATYTVQAVTPQKITSGIRKGSGRLLWSKTLEEMGINATDNMSTSIAISGEYILVNTRAIVNKYFNRFNGAYEGELPMAVNMVGSLVNFVATSDDAGNILVSNLTTKPGQVNVIYKWNGMKDSAPVKFIEWTNSMSGVNAQVGRKMSVAGDLNGDALIYMGVSQSGNSFIRWKVTGGVLQSQDPEKFTYNNTTKYWSYMADIAPVGTNNDDNIFISGYPCDLVYTNYTGYNILGQVDLVASGYGANHSLDLQRFNNTPYLAAFNVVSQYGGCSYLYDVTDPTKISTAPSSPDYADVCIYKTGIVASVKNANFTGDVLLKVSEDGYKMILYTFVTNGGISAYEFDCVDIDNL